MSYLSYSDKEKLISYLLNKIDYYFPFEEIKCNKEKIEWINIILYSLFKVSIIDEDESTCLYLFDYTFENAIIEIFDDNYESFISKFDAPFEKYLSEEVSLGLSCFLNLNFKNNNIKIINHTFFYSYEEERVTFNLKYKEKVYSIYGRILRPEINKYHIDFNLSCNNFTLLQKKEYFYDKKYYKLLFKEILSSIS